LAVPTAEEMRTVNGRPKKLLFAVALGAVVLLFNGCGILGPQLQTHGFSFDARRDSPDVDILDYQYGSSRHPGATPSQQAKEAGRIGASGVFGPMLKGEFLYVKWRIKRTGEIFEDRVDLNNRLPRDISNHEVFFLVDRRQLYVFLISPEKRPADWPNYLDLYRHRKVYQIYPDFPN
jgi:hypothetical protein